MSFPIWETLNTYENKYNAHGVTLEYKNQMVRGSLTWPADLLWDIEHLNLFFFLHDRSSEYLERHPRKRFLLIISNYFLEVHSDLQLNKSSMLWEHQFKHQMFVFIYRKKVNHLSPPPGFSLKGKLFSFAPSCILSSCSVNGLNNMVSWFRRLWFPREPFRENRMWLWVGGTGGWCPTKQAVVKGAVESRCWAGNRKCPWNQGNYT